jgi:hypothetical protein
MRAAIGHLRSCAIAVVVAIALALVGAASASASSHWRISARPAPTNLPLEGNGFVDVLVTETGEAELSATNTPVTIKDTLPSGITATSVLARWQGNLNGEFVKDWKCSGVGTSEVTCSYNPSGNAENERFPITQYEDLELQIHVAVKAPAGAYRNTVGVDGARELVGEPGKQVEGGVVPSQESFQTFEVDGQPTTFGVEAGGYSIEPENENGMPDRRAGAHPFQLTTTFDLNQTLEPVELNGAQLLPAAPGLAKNLHFNLPPGLLGNVTKVPTCAPSEFGSNGKEANVNQCEEATAIGVARVTLDEPKLLGLTTFTVPVFNLEPLQGEPARFGFIADHVPVYLETHVRSGDGSDTAGGGDFGVEVSVDYTTELAQVLGTEVTLWGAPGDESHDRARGWACVEQGRLVNKSEPCGSPESRVSGAFLTMPTSCATPVGTAAAGESWPVKKPEEPGLGATSTLDAAFTFPAAFENCASLPFGPSIKLAPTASSAATPTGLEVDVHVPQASTLEREGLGESAVKATTVTLPEGVQLSPSAADGLEACSEEQIGYQPLGRPNEYPIDPYSPSSETREPLRFSPTVTSPTGEQVLTNCPPASKVGSVRIKTPLLKDELDGSVYLATPYANPVNNSLVALYIAAEDPNEGVRVKVAGEVKLNPSTGQITSTFVNTPQVPFEDFVVDFDSGPRASVSTPASCGGFTTAASFTPWSTSVPQQSSSQPGEFQITSGPGGGACPNPQPFGPAFTAGSGNAQAGTFTPFSVTITRPDGQQALKSVSVTLPPGAAAILKSVEQCPEPQASLGTCGSGSLIGHANATVGYGSDPFTTPVGSVYLTGPYGGAPFGLSIVTPAIAGPFNLGNVVVRSAISVNRTTAAVTITSVLPTIVQGVGMPSSGIPLQLHSINVVVDRPNFEFNPTNCSPMTITGTLAGDGGASVPVSAPFQVGNCSALPFHPKLEASTRGNASKPNGASLTVTISATAGEANIGKTKLVLPIALPSRLTTIQKACPDSTFEVNPAACDEGSNIGSATVHTPVLKSPLSGPAYLVSHGSAAFPDVEFVLQGEGIELILDGQTDIKKGITTSTFNAVPDAPIEKFETTLPEGPHSALTSNVPPSKNFSLCGAKLLMPTTITGQSGVVIQQQTNIKVLGCGAVKGVKYTRAQLLKKALAQCRKRFKHSKQKRVTCERQARKKYGPVHKKSTKRR